MPTGASRRRLDAQHGSATSNAGDAHQLDGAMGLPPGFYSRTMS